MYHSSGATNPEREERAAAFAAVDNIPSIHKKAQFCFRRIDSIQQLEVKNNTLSMRSNTRASCCSQRYRGSNGQKTRYNQAFAFSATLPDLPSAFLAVCFPPTAEKVGLTTFRNFDSMGQVSPIRRWHDICGSGLAKPPHLATYLL